MSGSTQQAHIIGRPLRKVTYDLFDRNTHPQRLKRLAFPEHQHRAVLRERTVAEGEVHERLAVGLYKVLDERVAESGLL